MSTHEQELGSRQLGPGGQATLWPAYSGHSAGPPEARCLDERGDWDGHGTAKPKVPGADISQTTPCGAAGVVDGVRPAGHARGRRRCAALAGQHLGAMGQGPFRVAQPLSGPGTIDVVGTMRPVDVVALLNSTPLGTVIGERQLYRQRLQAGNGVRVGRRINFLAYVAWLCRQRHTPAPRPDQAVSYKDILELLETQDYRCALSGRPLTPETAALDHVLAISRGGSHTRSNLQILHRDVNRAKHTLTNEEFVSLCCAVVEHTSNRANVGRAPGGAGTSVPDGGPATPRGQTWPRGGRPGGGGSACGPRQGGLEPC